VAGQIVGLLVVLAAAVAAAPSANWDVGLFAILLGFSIFSDLTATSVGKKIKISGSFLALVLSMVFLGGAPAVVIGLITTVAAWMRWREATHYLIHNLLNYSLFPLIGGVLSTRSPPPTTSTTPMSASTSSSSGSSCCRWRSTSRSSPPISATSKAPRS